MVAAVVALAGGAGAATKMLILPAADDREATRKPRGASVFVALDQFTVNLADEGGERLAQVAVTLEVADDAAGTALKSRMPSVRNTILLLLSSKRTEDLLSVDGKKQLAVQIADQSGRQLGWQPTGGNNPIEAVHFSHFIVQ